MTSRMQERLSRDQVHVWTASPADLGDPATIETRFRLLSDEEKAGVSRLRFEKDRRTRLLGRSLLRTVLSRYAEVAPAAWVFRYNEHGRPELVPGQCDPPLRFNVSHTEGLVACGVSVDREIGVDVECLSRRASFVSIAARFFAPDEVRALHALAAEDRPGRFLENWTLKESYIKARGLGLFLPLGHFAFEFEDGGPIRISFDSRIEDDPGSWQFALFRPTAGHVLAVAVRRGGGPEVMMRLRRAAKATDGSDD